MYLEVIKTTANLSICRCLGKMPLLSTEDFKRDYKRREYKGHSRKAMFSSLKQEVASNIFTVLQNFMDYMTTLLRAFISHLKNSNFFRTKPLHFIVLGDNKF